MYDAPSAEALLSDAFLQTHCFGVVKPPREHPDWIGIAFAPRGRRDSLVDVTGVVWLDRSTAELRRLEFEYTNMPHEVYEMCDDDPRKDVVDRLCQRFIEKGLNKFGIGGDVDYRRLASGEWLTVRWTLRTPSNDMAFRPGPRKIRYGNRNAESCTGPVKPIPGRGDCTYVYWPVPRLSAVSTAITRVARAGVEIYRDDSSRGLIDAVARTQAGKKPASLEGVIVDGASRPLRNAIVQTEKPGRVSMTDTRGGFRIQTLPVGPILVSVRCRGYQPASFRVPLLPDSTRRISLTLVSDGKSGRISGNCSGSE